VKSPDSNIASGARNGRPAKSVRVDGEPLSLEEQIRRRALDLGFAACGLAGAHDLDCGPLLERWLADGRHGDMNYLAEKHERRVRPGLVLAGARSAIVVAWSYAAPLPPDPDWRQSLTGRIAGYAAAPDYHVHVAAKLERLAAWIRERTGDDCAVHVDGGPLVEKELARRAGLGWYGRNTNLIRPSLGSTFVLGTILTQAPLVPDAPFATDHCGTCTACIPACPTGALENGPTIDARLCISYLTIELRGPLPRELRPRVGNWVFGCDACQDVCPWNGDALAAAPAHRPWLPGWLAMSEEEFREHFLATPMGRPKRRGLARNAAVALGNSANPAAVPLQAPALREHTEPLVRAHAAWALGRLGGGEAVAQLHAASGHESVPPVRREIGQALAAGNATRGPA
jgi:epoxyqueuosine reductase